MTFDNLTLDLNDSVTENPPLDPDRKEEERVFAEAEAVGLSRTAKIVSDSRRQEKKAVLFEGEEASLEAEYMNGGNHDRLL